MKKRVNDETASSKKKEAASYEKITKMLHIFVYIFFLRM